MSEDKTHELTPTLQALRDVRGDIAAMRAEFEHRFDTMNVRLERLEARTTPLQTLLEQLVNGQRELRSDFAEMRKDWSQYKAFTLKSMGDHEHRILELEERKA
jgi:predicted  nucleic acid-binding Zn-ribbon protein